MMRNKFHRFVLFFLCIIHLMLSVCSNSTKGQQEKPLLQKQISIEHFLNSYDYVNLFEGSQKRLSGEIQGYITPWNSKGYDNAKLFASKLSLASPVWLQIKPDTFEFGGRHDVDIEWMATVKSVNKNTRFVPRVLFDNWDANQYQNMFSSNSKRTDCIRSIRDIVKQYDFDGITLEVWLQHYGTSQLLLIEFLNELAKGLHMDDKIIVLPIPPSVYKGNYQGRFLKEHFDLLADKIDFFNLMAYDYSNPHSPGENSPILWATECVQTLVPNPSDSVKRRKILLGLNFYGYDYTPSNRDGRVVLANDVVNVAKMFDATFQWHEKTSEHSMEYTDSSGTHHSLYFPTVYSVAKRVALAEELGVGLSIWEIGQGFNSLFGQL